MAMIVQIMCRETIKPSSPTPHYLRTYNLSLLDQLTAPMYSPIILLYSTTTSQDCTKKSTFLKKSLSETLTHFYPFAGRIKDAFSIDCNDHGAHYIEAHVAGDMSMVLKQSDVNQLWQLLPCNPHSKLTDLGAQVILAVQVNYFACGGMAIGVCIWHAVASASVVAYFVKSWAEVACGANDVGNVVVDCTALFPPRDLLGFTPGDFIRKDLLLKIVTKKFIFEESRIVALKEKLGGSHPTRVGAVSALIWGAMIAVAQEKVRSVESYVALQMVNLRKRMNPPLPEKCIGNIIQPAVAEWPADKSIDYNGLVGKFRESTRMISNEYVRKLHENDGYLNFIKNRGEDLRSSEVFSFSSWCRLPFYEVDFGWGKPIWVVTPMGLKNSAILVDTRDGEGIEALIGMLEEDMAKFEQHPEILAYASFTPSRI